MNYTCKGVFVISVYCLCITWRICVILTSSWQLEGLWLCVCLWGEMNSPYTHTYTDMHVVGWCVLSRLCRQGELGPSSISNQSLCTWTWLVCWLTVGIICQHWILLNMHFVSIWKQQNKTKKRLISNLFIVVSVYLENPVFRCTLYIQCCTLQRYTLFWYNIVQ